MRRTPLTNTPWCMWDDACGWHCLPVSVQWHHSRAPTRCCRPATVNSCSRSRPTTVATCCPPVSSQLSPRRCHPANETRSLCCRCPPPLCVSRRRSWRPTTSSEFCVRCRYRKESRSRPRGLPSSPPASPPQPASSNNTAATHTYLTALFLGLPRWAGTRKVEPIWILLKQETVSGSGTSWTRCKSAPCSR